MREGKAAAENSPSGGLARRWPRVLAALVGLTACTASASDPLLADAGGPPDAALAGDVGAPPDAGPAGDAAAAGSDARAPGGDAGGAGPDAGGAGPDAGAAGPDAGAAGPDAGVGVDPCAPSLALVGRVAPARLRADLDALVGLGDRASQPGQMRAAGYLRSQLAELGVSVREQSYTYVGQTFVNLEVTIPGSGRADEIVMAGAHYDCEAVTPGADDNASGTAAVLETVRVLAGCRPERSVRLLFFSNEEGGQAGSTAYVAELAGSVAPSRVVGFIAMDMVAYPGPRGELYLAARPAYRPLVMAMQAAVEEWTPLPTALRITDDCG